MTSRVAVVCPNFVNGHFGGVEAVAVWLRDAIRAEQGFDAEILSVATSRSDSVSARLAAPSTWRRGPTSRRQDVRGASVEHFGAWGAELEPLRYLPRSRLSERLREFDLVQVVSGTPAFGLVASGAGRPVCLLAATTVASERHYDVVGGRSMGERVTNSIRAANTSVVSRLERRALVRADHTFVMNGWMLNQVEAVKGAAVTLAPPGVDDRTFVPAAGYSHQGYLLTVGRLGSDRKNLAGLVRSYRLARDRQALMLPLVIAGGGALPGHLRGLIAQLGLNPHVHVIEDPPDEELVRLYQGATLFVHASLEEGLGMVYLEAQSCGVPVVSTINAGTTEIFARGAVGELVEPFDGISESLARAMADWSARGEEVPYREGARVFATAQFGAEVSTARFVDRYRELMP